jgi:hypothetical protein
MLRRVFSAGASAGASRTLLDKSSISTIDDAHVLQVGRAKSPNPYASIDSGKTDRGADVQYLIDEAAALSLLEPEVID